MIIKYYIWKYKINNVYNNLINIKNNHYKSIINFINNIIIYNIYII